MTFLQYITSRSVSTNPNLSDFLLVMSSDGSVVKKVSRSNFFGPGGIIEAARLPQIPLTHLPDVLTGKDADTLDGHHASATPGNGFIPVGGIDGRLAWGAKPAFRGCLAYNNAIAGVGSVFSFSSVDYDTDSILKTAGTNRLEVPEGVTKVRLSGMARTASWPSTQLGLKMLKNGGMFRGGPEIHIYDAPPDMSYGSISISSPVITVVAGDYFQMQNLSGESVPADTTGYDCWFAMEIIE